MPRFTQLYIYDTYNEVNNMIGALIKEGENSKIDPHIVDGLLHMLDKSNALIQNFRMARDRFQKSGFQDVSIQLIASHLPSENFYIDPIYLEVVAIIVGDISYENCGRDTIIDHKSNGLQRIY